MQTRTELYFEHGNIIAQSNNVKVYEMNDQLFLEIGPGHNLWALENEYDVYMEQFKQKTPKGKCLEVGLGLGVASRCILTFPAVKHLTTIEIDKDVIKTHKQLIEYLDERTDKWLPYDPTRHTIIHNDGLSYLLTTKNKYDYVFLDFYKALDEDSLPLISDMVHVAKCVLNEGGIIWGWLDPHTPAEFYEKFEKIFD